MLYEKAILSRYSSLCYSLYKQEVFRKLRQVRAGRRQVPVFIGQDMEAIGGIEGKEGYVNFFGTPAGITIYTNIRPGDVSYGYTYQGLDGLTSNANWGAGNCFADAQLASPLLKGCDVAIGLELVNHEEKVASGEHDSYIIRLGEWIQNIAPRRVFLRIGYEFDGHAWNHYQPEAYITAFRRIHTLFDSLNISNVAYVWQSTGGNSSIGQNFINITPVMNM